MNRCVVIVYFFTALGSAFSYAEPDFNFSGYLKSFVIAQSAIEIDSGLGELDDIPAIYQSQNAMRLMTDAFTGDNIAWQAHYEVNPVLFSRRFDSNPFAADTTYTTAGNTYRLTDFNETLGNPTPKQKIYQNLDRLNAQFNLTSGDLTIGRQVISMGSARIVSPTDVFLPFKATTLNQEFRTGIDMVRFQKPIGDLGELDTGIVIGDGANADNSAAFVKRRTNWRGSDVTLTALRFAEQNLLGSGIESSVGDMGVWFETALAWGAEDYNRTSLGVDYSLSCNIFFQIEYYYNGAGETRPEDYAALADHIGYQKGGIFLLGKEYIMPSLSWTTTPLLNLTLSSLINLSDSSAFFNLAGAYSLWDNLEMGFGIYFFRGDKLSSTPLPTNLVLQSEYGSYPDLVYLGVRYYF